MAALSFAQEPIRYLYDEHDRLVEMVDSAGNRIQYRYDADGNVTAINRFALRGASSGAEVIAGAKVPPTNVSPAATASTGTLTIDGEPIAVSLFPGQTGRYTFTAAAGQRLGLGISDAVTTPTSEVVIVVRGPDNSARDCAKLPEGGASCNLTDLPAGTHTVEIDSLSAAELTLTLSSDVTQTLAINGATQTFNVARVGQNATYTFTASAGQGLDLSWKTTLPRGIWTLYAPDGSYFNSALIAESSSRSWVAEAGTYRMFVEPYDATGDVTFRLVSPLLESLTIDGPALDVSLLPGQSGAFIFARDEDDNLSLGIGTNQAFRAIVFQGKEGLAGYPFIPPPGSSVGMDMLTAPGEYGVGITPIEEIATELTLTLSRDLAGVLKANGPPTTFSTARVGQRGRYAVAEAAGQGASVLVADSTLGAGSVLMAVGSFGAYDIIEVDEGGPSVLDLGVLPSNEPRAVLIWPGYTSTGSASLTLILDLTASLTVNSGTPASVATRLGQNARLSFRGTGGTGYTVAVTGLSTTPPGGEVEMLVVDRNDNPIVPCGTFTTDTICDVPPLPATGTYRVLVKVGAKAAAFRIAVNSTAATGSAMGR